MKRWSILCLMTLAAFVGCTRSVNTVGPANPNAQANVIADSRVITDRALGRHLGATRVIESTVSGDLLKVQIDLVNLRRDALSFNYRFDWYNDDGMLVQTPTSIWKPMRLLGGETTSIAAVAPSPRAVDFKIKFVMAND